jgi:hypothetical protein
MIPMLTLGLAAIFGGPLNNSAAPRSGHSQTRFNYSGRKQFTAGTCPSLDVSITEFGRSGGQADEMEESLAWTNIGTKDIESFELGFLPFDPFNRAMFGSRATFPGHNSANYTPLKVGESDKDGTTSRFEGDVYTEYVFVRAIRFTDGTVWTASMNDLASSIKKQTPGISFDAPKFRD